MHKRQILVLLAICMGTAVTRADSLKEIVARSGVTGGVAVHLGCGAGASIVEIPLNDRWLVYGLDIDAVAIEQAKKHIASHGIYGQVSAERYDGRSLPFGDDIVNLILIDDAADVRSAEIQRVLVPNGVVLSKPGAELSEASGLQREGVVNGWEKHRKPWPEDIDEWTHFLYGPENNAVSRDRRIGKPEHVQWFAGPEHSRDHDALASMSAMTSSDGRVFYIYDEGPISVIHQPADWKLIARDAFNGKLLWKREIPTWMTHLYNFRGGPVQLTRRLVSVGAHVYVTLGFDTPVTKLDAATGETLITYDGSDNTEELILHDGLLLTVLGDPEFLIEKSEDCEGYWELAEQEEATIAKQIVAYDAETGQQKWKLDQDALKGLVPLSLCASGKRVFYLDDKQLHCLDAQSGKSHWASSFATEGLFIRSYAPTVVVDDNVIMCMTVDVLRAYSVETGQLLWEHKGSNGFGSPADLFVIDGKAWMRTEKTALAIDVHTGEIATTLPFATNQHHHRCFRNKATEDCIIIGYSGIQIFDLERGTTDLNQWVRGICQYGMMPANGYIYVPPDPCKCYADVKINGFYVLAERNSLDDIEIESVLEKGDEYGLAMTSDQDPDAWPTYRGDASRSGGTNYSLPEPLRIQWEANIGTGITASTIADSRVYVAEKDAYTAFCLDVQTGKELWRFMANGPIEAPPTIEAGFCVLGCGDGSVYCLDAENGGLVWRFKVSGLERRIGGENRLEAPWRINGAVLVLDDTVYFSAGRSSHLDDGIRLYGVDLVSGRMKYHNVMKSKPDSRSGVLADMLAARSDDIEMRNAVFDRELHFKGGKTSVKGMLNSSWFHRQSGPGGKGQMSVQNEAGAFSIGNPYTGLKQRRSVKNTSQIGSKWNQVGHLHQKYTRYLQKEWFPVGISINGKGWSVDEDIQARTMLVAGEKLYVAGWIDEVAIELKTGRSAESVKPRQSVLRVYSVQDGNRIREYRLDSEPVWDSAAVAYDRLLLSLKSGKLICMGK